MRIRANTAAIVLPLFFFLGIGGTMINGYWRTESSKIPAVYREGELAGEYDPGDIRGSYSLGDLEKAFDIPVETLAQAYGLSGVEDPASLQIKIFEELYGMIDGREIGTDSMRLFVALYLDRPYMPEDDTALPRPAYNILKKEGSSPAEALAAHEGRIVSLEDAAVHTADTAGTEDSHDEQELTEIKGKTTFADLLDRGLSRDQIEDALGMPMGARADAVRDYCIAQDVEFSGVKAALQKTLDALE